MLWVDAVDDGILKLGMFYFRWWAWLQVGVVVGLGLGRLQAQTFRFGFFREYPEEVRNTENALCYYSHTVTCRIYLPMRIRRFTIGDNPTTSMLGNTEYVHNDFVDAQPCYRAVCIGALK